MSTVTGSTATTVNVVAPAQIQDGVNLAASGATVKVAAGNYTEDVDASAKTLTLSPGPGTAQVRLTGNFKLVPTTRWRFDLNGTNPATQYDNFVVSGSATLGNSTLAVTLRLRLHPRGWRFAQNRRCCHPQRNLHKPGAGRGDRRRIAAGLSHCNRRCEFTEE